MAEDHDQSFGKIAVENGYCSQAQLDDAVHTLNEVRRLGLDEKLGTICIKKKLLSEEQVRSILKQQGQSTTVKLANYEILAKIGQGGMGAVFKARQISLDRIVALKVLNPKLAEDKTFCERFIKEARSVAKLSHPNIIVGIDVGQEGKYYYFAMEYIDGKTTLQTLRESGPFTETRALHIAFQIAQALDHAHKHGLVHRDIKPDNIMLSSRDEAKLCDLGLAKMTEADASLTQVDSAVGTPHYIAPEQARGEHDTTISADLYALGASLYHMTTGTTLFSGNNSREIMVQHLLGEGQNARKLRPELSEGFCRLLEKLLAKEKSERYQTPEELIADLERVRENKPIKALPFSAKSSMARAPKNSVRRNDATTTGPRAPVTRPDDTTGPRIPLERPEPTTGPKTAVQNPRVLIAIGAAALVVVIAGILYLASGSAPQPVAKAPEVAKQPAPDPALKAVGTSDPGRKPPQDVPKAPEKAAQPALPWEPLEKVRQARKNKPDDYLNLATQLEALEKSAPPEQIANVRREKSEVEGEVFRLFQELLRNRVKEARLRMEAKNYPMALGQFVEQDYPPNLMTTFNRDALTRMRADFENDIATAFNSAESQKLADETKASEGDAAKLKELRKKLARLDGMYPVKGIKEQLQALDKKLEQAVKDVEALALKGQDVAFRRVCDTAFEKAAEKNDLPAALAAVEEAMANPSLKDRYGAKLEMLKRDLQSVQKAFQQVAAFVETKINSNEQITFHAKGVAYNGPIRSLCEVSGKPGFLIKDGASGDQRLLFAEIEAKDIATLARLDDKVPSGRYQKGVVFFWNGSLPPAYESLKPLKGEPAYTEAAAFYLDWMEGQAANLLEQIHALGRELQNPKLPEAHIAEKREAMGRMVKQFKRDYSATEVYRARTKR